MNRETIVKLLTEVAEKNNINVDLRPGSPMYVYLVDLLAATLSSLVEQTDRISTSDRADNFYVTEGKAVPSEFTVRLSFWEPTSLLYVANSMTFTSGGSVYSNKYPVSCPAQTMAFYTDGVYFYHDIVLEGETPVSSSTVLTLKSPPPTFSHVVIFNITHSGSAPYSDTELEDAIRRELSLRNNVTRPGIIAYLSNLYSTGLKDILVQGFLDPEQNRDIYTVNTPGLGGGIKSTSAHMGGCVDVYLKGASPVQRMLKFDALADEEVEIERGYTICQNSTLPHTNLTSFYMKSWVRPSEYIFSKDIDYTIHMNTGVVTLPRVNMVKNHIIAGSNIMSGGIEYPGDGLIDNISGRIIYFSNDASTYMNIGHIVQLVAPAGAVLDSFIVNDIDGYNILLDHDTDPNDVSNTVLVRYLEPLRCIYKYNPIGAKLEDFESPVLSLDSVNIMDPLTDEEIEEEIFPMPGFGHGKFGGGGFGIGEKFGYFMHTFDELLRYSMRETGFLEIPNEFEIERVGVNYHTDPTVGLAQTDLMSNRARPADVLAFSFVPVIADIVARIHASEEINPALVSDMIWGMPGGIELSDIIDKMYDMGATYVNIDDLFNASTYTVWHKDGTLTAIQPTPDGRISTTSIIERFLPRKITLNYED